MQKLRPSTPIQIAGSGIPLSFVSRLSRRFVTNLGMVECKIGSKRLSNGMVFPANFDNYGQTVFSKKLVCWYQLVAPCTDTEYPEVGSSKGWAYMLDKLWAREMKAIPT